MAYVLGITGGVGTGKSEVLRILEDCGFKTIRTDEVAKELMTPGSELMKRLAAVFGDKIILPSGELDKEYYGNLIYSDSKNMALSNSIVHPAVWKRVREIIENSDAEKWAVETAVPDKNFRELSTAVWYIHAPLKVRMERLMRKRGYSAKKCFDIISKQQGEKEFGLFADFIIENGGSLASTEKQIRELI